MLAQGSPYNIYMPGQSPEDLKNLFDMSSLAGLDMTPLPSKPSGDSVEEPQKEPVKVKAAEDPAAEKVRIYLKLDKELPKDAMDRLAPIKGIIDLKEKLPASLKRLLVDLEAVGASEGFVTYRFELPERKGSATRWYLPNRNVFKLDASDKPKPGTGGPSKDLAIGTMCLNDWRDLPPTMRQEEVSSKCRVILRERGAGFDTFLQFADREVVSELLDHLDNLMIDPLISDQAREAPSEVKSQKLRRNRRSYLSQDVDPVISSSVKVERFSIVKDMILESLKRDFPELGTVSDYPTPEIFKIAVDKQASTADVYLKLPPREDGEARGVRVKFSVFLNPASILQVEEVNRSKQRPLSQLKSLAAKR